MTLPKTLLAGCLAISALLAQAEVTPSRGAGDARLRFVNYQEGEVYRLSGVVGYQMDLEFEPGEMFMGLGAGDLDALTFVAQGNHLFIKPKAAPVATNLTVLTNRRVYHFDYSASRGAYSDPEAGRIYAVQFRYPKSPSLQALSAALEREKQADLQAALEMGPVANPRNERYGFCGDRALKPLAAWDNGVHTHLRFPPRAAMPAIFVSESPGAESLVNFHLQGEEVVIHRVARQFVLRRGSLVACISNEAWVGGGLALPTGTISPAVHRQLRESGR
ncbi:MAG: Type IV secretion system protein virB9 [Steroidobacteraceae bacterium]|nr:Type IV secretion system protein virB9 [Steroidobacteraceae bacterium]